MFTEIGAVLGMASFILIIISSIVKTFSEDKDWQKRIDEINLRCDVDLLKKQVRDLQFGESRREANRGDSTYVGTTTYSGGGYIDNYKSNLTKKTYAGKYEMLIGELDYRIAKLERKNK